MALPYPVWMETHSNPLLLIRHNIVLDKHLRMTMMSTTLTLAKMGGNWALPLGWDLGANVYTSC